MRILTILLLGVMFLRCNTPLLFEKNPKELGNTKNLESYNDLLLEIGKVPMYSEEAANFAKNDKSTGGITFTGSSTITRWTTVQQDFPMYYVRNHGIGGSTFDQVIAHSENLIFFNYPKIVVLYSGDNDAYLLSIERYKRYMDCFVQNFMHRLPESYLIFIGVKPGPARKDKFSYYTEVNKYLNELAMTSDNLYFINIWTPIEQGDTYSYFGEDMIHLNRKGYELVIDKLSPIFSGIPLLK